jgi:hypothetical protein
MVPSEHAMKPASSLAPGALAWPATPDIYSWVLVKLSKKLDQRQHTDQASSRAVGYPGGDHWSPRIVATQTPIRLHDPRVRISRKIL